MQKIVVLEALAGMQTFGVDLPEALVSGLRYTTMW